MLKIETITQTGKVVNEKEAMKRDSKRDSNKRNAAVMAKEVKAKEERDTKRKSFLTGDNDKFHK
jgi:hypothetical protein